jgi:tripartite-type tricarboxylate transporter receptor subunit TctC
MIVDLSGGGTVGRMQERLRVVIALMAIVGGCVSATAQSDEGALFGKTINILIGAAAGGVLDTPARLVARHLTNHLPGKPAVVVANMPGAASNILARHLYLQAAKDGSVIGVTFPSIVLEPLLSNVDRRGYDPSKFNFLGSAQNYIPLCLVRKDSKVKSLGDLLTQDLITGGTASGSMTYEFPLVGNALAGTRFKLVKGYSGGPDLLLALERGELEATCVGWSNAKIKYPDLLKGTMPFTAFLQGSLRGDPELNAAGVPTMESLRVSPDQRSAIELFLSQNEYSTPFLVPPGVPEDRISALRSAFVRTVNDPSFLQEAKNLKLELSVSGGEDIQNLVAKAYRTPKTIVDLVRAAIAQ